MKIVRTLSDIKADPRVESFRIEYDSLYEPTGKLYIGFLATGWTNDHLECTRIQGTTIADLLCQLNNSVNPKPKL